MYILFSQLSKCQNQKFFFGFKIRIIEEPISLLLAKLRNLLGTLSAVVVSFHVIAI